MPISTISITGSYRFAEQTRILNSSFPLHNGQLDVYVKRRKDALSANIAEDIAILVATDLGIAIEPTTILVKWEIEDTINYANATMQHEMTIASLTDLLALKHFINLVLPDNGSNKVDGKWALVVMHKVQHYQYSGTLSSERVGSHTPVEPQLCFVTYARRYGTKCDGITPEFPPNFALRETNLTSTSNLLYRCCHNTPIDWYGPVMAVIAQFPISSSEKNSQDFDQCQKLFLSLVESYKATARPVLNSSLEDIRFDPLRAQAIRKLLDDHCRDTKDVLWPEEVLEAVEVADRMLLGETNAELLKKFGTKTEVAIPRNRETGRSGDTEVDFSNNVMASVDSASVTTATTATQNHDSSWCFTALRRAANNALSCLGRCNDTTLVVKPGSDHGIQDKRVAKEIRLALS